MSESHDDEEISVTLPRWAWKYLLEQHPHFVTSRTILIQDALRRAITNGDPK